MLSNEKSNNGSEEQKCVDNSNAPELETLLKVTRKSIPQIIPVIPKSLSVCEKTETNFLASAFGSVTTVRSIGAKQTINARTVLWYLVFTGFAVNYMLRINMNIAIVDMSNAHKSFTVSQCANTSHLNELFSYNNSIISTTPIALPSPKTRFSFVLLIFDWLQIKHHGDKFIWNELQQSRVLGSFFWFHWILQIPGGILAKRYGTKLIFGLSNLVVSLICLIIPISTYWHVNALIFLRVVQGLIAGLSWPSMHHMAAQWVPPDERSKFISSYLGSSVGIAVFYPLFGQIIELASWELVFYVSGIVGIIWYICWCYFVFDTPAQHLRIDPMEKHYIEKSLMGTVNADQKHETPWKAIICSRAVWINVVAQWGCIWALFTLMTQAPTYFRVIHGWNVKMIGLLSGLPHIARMIFAYIFSVLGDSLLRNKKMSRTNVRKLAGAMCTLVNGIFVLALAFSGCNSTAALIFFTMATAVHGAVSTGPLASIIDLSPNFSGVVLGITGMIAVWPGFISAYIVGILTLGNSTIQQWQYVFLITAGMLFVCGIIYVLFAESNLQSWNQPEMPEEKTKNSSNKMRALKISLQNTNNNS